MGRYSMADTNRMAGRTRVFMAAVLLSLGVSTVQAEVSRADTYGFHVTLERHTTVEPATAYDGLGQVQAWWSSAHSWSGDAANFRLELRPGGCLCEALPEDGFVEHLRVVAVMPGREIRLAGGLGPLQAIALSGVMRWQVEATESGGSRLAWEYVLDGPMPEQPAGLASAVDGVLAEQLDRFQHWLETGSPEPAVTEPEPSAD